MSCSVRPAEAVDAAEIARIYAEGIAVRQATVVAHPPSVDEMAERMAAAPPAHTWLVAVEHDRVVGWAATMPYLDLAAYAGIAASRRS